MSETQICAPHTQGKHCKGIGKEHCGCTGTQKVTFTEDRESFRLGETVPSGALLLVTELDCTALAALAPHPLNSSGITDWATAQETVSETPSGSTQTKPHLYFCAK